MVKKGSEGKELGYCPGLQSVAGSLQSLCWGASAVGGISSAYFSGSLVGTWGPRPVFALTAIFPLVVCLSSILISELPKVKNDAELQRPGAPYLSSRPLALLSAASLVLINFACWCFGSSYVVL